MIPKYTPNPIYNIEKGENSALSAEEPDTTDKNVGATTEKQKADNILPVDETHDTIESSSQKLKNHAKEIFDLHHNIFK